MPICLSCSRILTLKRATVSDDGRWFISLLYIATLCVRVMQPLYAVWLMVMSSTISVKILDDILMHSDIIGGKTSRFSLIFIFILSQLQHFLSLRHYVWLILGQSGWCEDKLNIF
jgi:hypothetical protein